MAGAANKPISPNALNPAPVWVTRTCTSLSTTTPVVAYVEAHDNETAATLVKFWRRAQDWFCV